MSTTRTYEIVRTETKEIVSSEDFLKTIESLKKMLDEKLSKLSGGLSAAKVFIKDGTIFIKDKYGTLKNLEQEFSAFGFEVEQIKDLFKASDRITRLLGFLDEKSLQQVVTKNFSVDESLSQVVKNLKGIEIKEIENIKNNVMLNNIVGSLQAGKNYAAEDKIIAQGNEYAHDYRNFQRVRSTERVVSRESNIRDSQKAFEELNSLINKINNSHKANLVAGVERLIENKACALGFTVKKTTVDKKTMLKLERGKE